MEGNWQGGKIQTVGFFVILSQKNKKYVLY